MVVELNEQEILRRTKLEEITKMGINAYPAELFEVNASAKEIANNFNVDNAEKYKLITSSACKTSRTCLPFPEIVNFS